MKQFLKNAILIFSLLFLFQVASYVLPNKNIRNNIDLSIGIINRESLYYVPISTNKKVLNGNMQDNFTDSIILGLARDQREVDLSVVNRSIANYTCEDLLPDECLRQLSSYSVNPQLEYSRYWYGTVSILRILFEFFDLYTIRYIFLLLVFYLIVVLFKKLSKELNTYYCMILMFVLLNVGILIVPFSLQFLPNFIIMLSSLIYILNNYKKRNFIKKSYYVFFVIGTLTSYFDLLTFPLITLCYPFVFWYILNKKQNKKISLKTIILIFMSWLLGYVGMFIYKFILSSLILNKNIFVDSYNKIMTRTSINDEINRIDAIKANYSLIFSNTINKLILVIYYLVFIIKSIKRRIFKKIDLYSVFVLFVVGLIPIIWYFVLSEHSTIHYWFTYRTSSITLLVLLVIPIMLYNDNKNEEGILV